ncbi:MAG TPA: NifU family protein [Acidimicrobiales bacterium]|nr:NifU family protein [Acidimicrobiales bacterium]
MEERVLSVSDEALRTVVDLRAEEDDPETLALWLEVNGATGSEYAYDLYFQAVADAGAGDAVERFDGLAVVVPEASVDKLRGANLDVRDGEMVLVNPNRPQSAAPAAPAEADLSSPVAQAVLRVLEDEINPAIASHGGMAQLVAVDDGTAYLRLAGGCQGCGMASVTLTQGIEVAIREAVPEIRSVVDVTDHAAGTNPYFEQAKK